ncbi:GDSL lipase/esterase [Glomus cerebriforme]|uniref:GDSL lipase/esterase n=1 Tax=Glomus cerebriforme TaxID=658196 RepID=A0A397TIE1_9GLOM|nr:GDSL lipase/esterase [Glomus cerebriforme]
MLSRMNLVCVIIYVSLLLSFSIEIIEATPIISKRETFHEKKPSPFNTVIIFGDSTCDNGNTWRLSNYTYPPKKFFYKGRFSNGPTWVEYLSKLLHAKEMNYAYGGATTDTNYVKAVSGFDGEIPVPGIKQEVEDKFKTQVSAKSLNPDKTLYIVAHQGNDYLNNPKIFPVECVKHLYDVWVELANFGAKHILINNFFNLKNLPEVTKNYGVISRLLTGLVSKMHNAAIDGFVWQFKRTHKDVKFYILPMDQVWEEFKDPNLKKSLGITDVNSACVLRIDKTKNYTICPNPDEHFYWDHIHPSTKVHNFIAVKVYNIITGQK